MDLFFLGTAGNIIYLEDFRICQIIVTSYFSGEIFDYIHIFFLDLQ